MPLPPLGYYFSVEILGTQTSNIEAGFQEAKGLSAEMETETINEGGESRFAHKVPKAVKYPSNLELKRGLIVSSSLFGDWCLDHLARGLNSKIVTQDLIVHLLDLSTAGGKPILSWAIARAYPVKWDIGQLDARKSEIVVESLSITYAYFTVL
jgi:phage tail-like protein